LKGEREQKIGSNSNESSKGETTKRKKRKGNAKGTKRNRKKKDQPIPNGIHFTKFL